MDDYVLGVLYFFLTCYLFLGIALISDLLMEALEVITSEVRTVQTADSRGNPQTLEKSVWSPSIANITLMAFGSSAPQIMLAIVDTVDHLGGEPALLGYEALVGSAAYNLLAVMAIGIFSTVEVKKINEIGSFNMTSLAQIFAYVWILAVLLIMSPHEVEIWEAVMTIAFFFALVLLAYGFDKLGQKNDDIIAQSVTLNEDAKKDVAKCALRAMASRYGTFNILEAARGNEPPKMTMDQINLAIDNYRVLFEVEELNFVPISDLLEVLNPVNPLERIAFRKKVAKTTTNRLEFVKIGRSVSAQIIEEKEVNERTNLRIGFMHDTYSVNDSTGIVTITVEKKIPEDINVVLRTVNDTAFEGVDFEGRDEVFMLKAHERVKNI